MRGSSLYFWTPTPAASAGVTEEGGGRLPLTLSRLILLWGGGGGGRGSLAFLIWSFNAQHLDATQMGGALWEIVEKSLLKSHRARSRAVCEAGL